MIGISRPSWHLLKQIVVEAKQELLICSPWLAESGLLKLRRYLNEPKASTELRLVQFWTRLADANTDSDILLELLIYLQSRGIHTLVRDSPDLHAKIYLADRRLALVSSANLSLSGFERNLEIAALFSGTPLMEQICRVLGSIEQETEEVSLEQLRYFVQEQRPLVLEEHKTALMESQVTPIWRQQSQGRAARRKPSPGNNVNFVQDKEPVIEEAETTSHAPSQGIAGFNPFELDDRVLAQLDGSREKILSYDLGKFVGKRVRITVYPCSNAWSHIMMSGGKLPFETLEGEVEHQAQPLEMGESFANPEPVGQEQTAWVFRPKFARKKRLIIANFPIASTSHTRLDGMENFYLTRIELVRS